MRYQEIRAFFVARKTIYHHLLTEANFNDLIAWFMTDEIISSKDLLDCLMIYTLISGEGNSSCGSSRNPGRVSLLKVIVFIMAACGIIALMRNG